MDKNNGYAKENDGRLKENDGWNEERNGWKRQYNGGEEGNKWESEECNGGIEKELEKW